MNTIYKYHLPIQDEVILDVPNLFRPLYVGEQDGALYLWALVNTGYATTPRRILIYGTGNPVDAASGFDYYIGTVQMSNKLVWHVVDGGWKKE